MIRGTTPTLEFTLPFDTEFLAEAYITIAQNNEAVIDKAMEECVAEGNKLSVQLTQEETLRLKHEYMSEIQIRVRTKEGVALASGIIRKDTGRILRDGVI